MAAISGLGGAIDGIDTLRRWSITPRNQIVTYGGSANDGAEGVNGGNQDWSATAEVYGFEPSKLAGETLTFTGYNGSKSWSGDAIIASVTVACDIAGGNLITHTLNIEGNGALSKGSTTVTDSAVPSAFTSIGCKVAIDKSAGTSFTDVAECEGWTFTLTSANKPRVTNSTAGQTKRVKGPLSGTASYTVKDADNSLLPAPGSALTARFFVNATDFYEFQWFVVESLTENTDIETGEYISTTVNLRWSGFTRIAGTMTKGTIVKPDETAFWP